MARFYILRKSFKDFWIRLPKTFKHSIKSIPSAAERFKNRVTTFSGGLTLICLIILSIIPLFTKNPYYLGIFIMAFIYSIYAGSWDFMTGYTGLVSFGHAIFLGLAGYGTSAAFRFWGLNWLVALLFGAVLSVIIGVLIAIPSLRLKGPYLALTMLSLSMILWYLFMMGELSPWLWGSHGITIYDIFNNSVVEYIVIFIIMILSLGIMKALGNAKFGKILNSIRDDEKGAEASGINTSKYKILSFMVSAFFAGIAGGLFAMHNYGVDPGRFQPLYSFYPIIMVAIGGLATISGGALGAFIFVFLNEILLKFAEALPGLPLFVFSIILMLIIRFAERGIMRPTIERLRLLWDILIGR